MKKITMICGSLLIAATLLFASCFKDKNTTIQNLIQIVDATLTEGSMPSATSDNEIDVIMGNNVIPGGSAFITVNSDVTAREIYVGIDGQTGYYVIPVATDGTCGFVMTVDQNIDLGEEGKFIINVAILDENGDVSQIWTSTIGLIAVGTGNLQVSLTFDQHKDIDLHLVEPDYTDADGYTWGGEHIYFGNETSENGGELDLDANAGCSTDEVWAENITYGDSAFVAPGLYKAYVLMWSNCSPQDAPTHYTLSVFYEGQLITTQNGVANPFVGTFAADAPSQGSSLSNVEPTITFTIPGRGQQRVKTFAHKELTQSAKEKLQQEME